MEEDLTEKDVAGGPNQLTVNGPTLTSELRLNPAYLEANLGPWASNKAFEVTPDRVIIDGDQATFSTVQIGEAYVFTWGDPNQVRFTQRPMWVSAHQDGYGSPITLDLHDGDPSGQTLTVAKKWLWDRGILGLVAMHVDGDSIDVAELEDAFDVHVDHFSEIILGPSDIVLGQVGSGPITQHLGEVRWNADYLTLKIKVANYLVTYTVYLQKEWADENMPEPLVLDNTWTTHTISGEPYYKIVLTSERTPTTVVVESVINDWWRLLEDGGALQFEADNISILVDLDEIHRFVTANGTSYPAHIFPNETVTSVVLYGRNLTSGATGSVVLKRNSVAAVINFNGSHRLNIPPLANGPISNSTNVGIEEGESIFMSRHIYDGNNVAIDPVNAIFYDQGHKYNTMLYLAGWEQTGVGTTKRLWRDDSIHGGSQGYSSQSKDYQDGEGFWGAAGNRMHLRVYPSSTGDTHLPGFNKYTAAPVHWEECFAHTCVEPTTGQVHLHETMAGLWDVGNVWHVYLDNVATDCENCGAWSGRIDIYQFGSSEEDPCPSPIVAELGQYIHLTCAATTTQFLAVRITPMNPGVS